MRNILIALATIVMLPAVAFAGTQATTIKTERGKEHIMCPTVEGTGVCDNGLTPHIYAVVDAYESVTFTLYDSAGASVAECEVFAAPASRTAVPTDDDISSLGGTKINSTSLSETQQKIQFNNINYKYMWVSCGVLDASSTVTMQGSVGLTRIGR
jgi:hypothetical protein